MFQGNLKQHKEGTSNTVLTVTHFGSDILALELDPIKRRKNHIMQ